MSAERGKLGHKHEGCNLHCKARHCLSAKVIPFVHWRVMMGCFCTDPIRVSA